MMIIIIIIGSKGMVFVSSIVMWSWDHVGVLNHSFSKYGSRNVILGSWKIGLAN